MKPILRHRLALLGILLAGTALRLFRLGADSLWYDETVSTALAGSPPAELLRHTAGDIHPPGYYMLLRGWLALAGYPTGHAGPHGIGLEFAAGFFSLFFGILLIGLVYALARRAANRRVALIAAALAAASPYNIWYSQEVRMYTLGAGLGVVAMYALLRALTHQRINESAAQRIGEPLKRQRRFSSWWVIYALAAAAGMYTLYYFVFLLIPLNLWVLWRIADGRWRMATSNGQGANRQPSTASRQLPAWLLANLVALALYAPWIPVAWRQAVNPPVPPWRTAPDLLAALRESWAALSLGQSAPAWLWPALLLTLGLYAVGLHALWQTAISRQPSAVSRQPSAICYRLSAIGYLPLATFGPLVLILALSAVTPLYHVRYLFTYSPAFYVVIAAGLAWLARRSKLAAGVAAACWLAAAGVTLNACWHDPAYRADDHRDAVRFLQERWRPGDVVLVDAGWAYTALTTYWDGPIAGRTRLTDDLPAARTDAALVMVTAGHVDGDPDLGWGDPRSDFFALPAGAARDQIAALFGRFDRVWLYRIYDTVNDPARQIRGWLTANGVLFEDQAFAGEANMRVQGYAPRQRAAGDPGWPSAAFGTGLALRVEPLPDRAAGGETLYPVLDWQPAGPVPDFATSIRLVGPDGKVWAQPPDEHPSGPQLPASRWTAGQAVRQTLALPVPAGTPPGRYVVELVVYDPSDGKPWPAQAGDLALTSNGLRLGEITIVRPTPPPARRPALATFGPLALVEAASPATTVAPGGQIPVTLLWQAVEAPGEPLVIVAQLQDAAGRVAAGLEEEPVMGRYPAQNWAAGELVRDRHTLALPPGLAPGKYRLIVGIYRAADRSRLETRAGLFGRSDHWVAKRLEVK